MAKNDFSESKQSKQSFNSSDSKDATKNESAKMSRIKHQMLKTAKMKLKTTTNQ